MSIQVLGSGCPTCQKLYELVSKAASEIGITDPVEYIKGDRGTQKIVELGLMSSPVLVVNNQPVMVGFTPDIDKIKRLLAKS